MSDPRDKFGPYWLQTAVPPSTNFGQSAWPNDQPQSALPTIDWSKEPIPPASPPWFPSTSPTYPWNGRKPAAWESIETPVENGGGILGSLPRSIPDDPFARAALRTRESVRPSTGRKGGTMLPFLAYYLSEHAKQLATLPQRAINASNQFLLTGEYDPGPALEAALLTVGTPLTPRGALGSSARRPSPRLPMDEASRMKRADDMGFRRDMPIEYGAGPADEKLAAAALNVNGRIFTGPTHSVAMENAERALGIPFEEMQLAPIADGFVTNAGRYVSRWEAGEIAQRASQGAARGKFGATRGLAAEGTAMSNVTPSSKVRIGTTAPGLPGGQGTWGWVLPEEVASTPASPLRRRTRQPSATEMSGPEIQTTVGAASPTVPIWHRTENPGALQARGREDYEIQASLRQAWD